ncbi:putative Trafficking protein particle complex subunit 3 [Blattamonas nauphoetae]|uniref:Trafficking protein particle complex subunit n=1 Tax=Blattamonas nauphoetae TaxID=2049346 RepID=A0ABQ9Y6G0_9EUKA|nr:putative Trafficking protein particle complex subunit 3 [Blattamonas nauphoetae]
MNSDPLQQAGENAWQDTKHVHSSLLSITYGCLVEQLVKDFADIEAVNEITKRMGSFIGKRVCDDVLSHAQVSKCENVKEALQITTKVGFRMMLNIQPTLTTTPDPKIFVLSFPENPLSSNVEIPTELNDIAYSNIICGVIEGALELLRYEVKADFVKEVVKGDHTNEIRVEHIRDIPEQISDIFET